MPPDECDRRYDNDAKGNANTNRDFRARRETLARCARGRLRCGRWYVICGADFLNEEDRRALEGCEAIVSVVSGGRCRYAFAAIDGKVVARCESKLIVNAIITGPDVATKRFMLVESTSHLVNNYNRVRYLRGTAKNRERIRAYTTKILRKLFCGRRARCICSRDVTRRTSIPRIEGFIQNLGRIPRRPSGRKTIGIPADMFAIAAGAPSEYRRAGLPLNPLFRSAARRGREDGRERTEIHGCRHGERTRTILEDQRWGKGEHDQVSGEEHWEIRITNGGSSAQ